MSFVIEKPRLVTVLVNFEDRDFHLGSLICLPLMYYIFGSVISCFSDAQSHHFYRYHTGWSD